VQRIPTPKVVVLTLDRFGRGLCLYGLGLALLLTPFCIYLDMRIGEHLRGIVQNEPVYYVRP
ncbi:MAG TPA: hypothetical protein VEX38_01240, partial [Fimbriimonadaceae bacterium]|nr:hypothetical protein [Fimbriimonadaceae bacterium]